MYPDHNEKCADRTNNCLGRCDAQYLLGEIQGLNGHIQRGDNIIPAFVWLDIRAHRPKST